MILVKLLFGRYSNNLSIQRERGIVGFEVDLFVMRMKVSETQFLCNLGALPNPFIEHLSNVLDRSNYSFRCDSLPILNICRHVRYPYLTSPLLRVIWKVGLGRWPHLVAADDYQSAIRFSNIVYPFARRVQCAFHLFHLPCCGLVTHSKTALRGYSARLGTKNKLRAKWGKSADS
jgi:hypothetical protein